MSEQPQHDHSGLRGLLTGAVVIGSGFLIAYINAFSQDVFPYTAWEVILSSLLGIIYLLLFIKEEDWFGVGKSLNRRLLFFTIQFCLALGTQLILRYSGLMWLVTMPLVGSMAVALPLVWRWVGYVAVALGVFVPYATWFSLETAVSILLSVIPAMIFVALFSQLLQREGVARTEAETLAKQLEGANRQLGEYATQAEELATTKERNRLAREIHDNLGHYLTVVNVQLKAAQAVMGQNPEKAQEILSKAQTLTEDGLTAVRQSVSTLRDSPVSQRPLPEAIRKLIEESQSSGIETALDVRGTPRSLEQKAELALFRAVQEGLTNARKHAHASRIRVLLDYSAGDQVALAVEDNGVGAESVASGGFGLVGIRERVQQLGGELEMATAPREGFRLNVAIPG